jgi:hypothetical protein
VWGSSNDWLIGLIGGIGFGLSGVSSLSASAARLACRPSGLVGLVDSQTHWPFCNRLATAILAAAKNTISRQHAQAAHGVAMVQSGATNFINVPVYYYYAALLFYAHLFGRETMWWWLALAKKKMCQVDYLFW